MNKDKPSREFWQLLELPKIEAELRIPRKLTRAQADEFQKWLETCVKPHLEFCIVDEEEAARGLG